MRISNHSSNPIGNSALETIGKSLSATLTHSARKKLHIEQHSTQNSPLNLKIQTSTYGKMIPEVYGTVRIAGNIIWAMPIRYTQHQKITVTDSTKEPGRSVTKIYNATLAIAICSGPLREVSKIWANGKPIWADNKHVHTGSANYRIYLGTEDQYPDPLILLTEGMAPAYLGLAYVVIENLPLSDYNNTLPNFVFEVSVYPEEFSEKHITRQIKSVYTLADGEFACDTEIQKRVNMEIVGEREIYYGTAVTINGEKGSTRSHIMSALHYLGNTLPNLQWVGITVTWFASSPNVENCKVYPATIYGLDVKTFPDEWRVGDFTKKNTTIIPAQNGVPEFHGTVSDQSLLRYMQELKSRGYKVLISLKLRTETGKRAELICLHHNNIDQFFRIEYLSFVKHYCTLSKGIVDAFVIGSGFGRLTTMSNRQGIFPAVKSLARIAKYAKRALGNEVIVTYAANWNEYHSYNGIYNMDDLWSSEYIDVIGINAYFPLEDESTQELTTEDIVRLWYSKEGYEYFYFNPEKKEKKIPYKNQDFAWKNILHWWSNYHENRDKSGRTSWVPKSKKVWFTEYGFRSVEHCTSKQHSSASTISFAAQKVAVEGTIKAWESSEMVEKMFLYSWNLAPYLGPKNETKRENWQTGYQVNGKIELISLSSIVKDILQKSGLPSDELEVRNINKLVCGYAIYNYQPTRTILKKLQKIYSFYIKEENTKITLEGVSKRAVIHIPEEDLILEEAKDVFYAMKPLGRAPALLYISAELEYQPKLKKSQLCVERVDDLLQIPVVLNDLEAEAIVDQLCSESDSFMIMISVPLKYITLNVGDVISTTHDERSYIAIITSVTVYASYVHLEGRARVAQLLQN